VKKDENPHGMMKGRSGLRDAGSPVGEVLMRILFATRRMPVRFVTTSQACKGNTMKYSRLSIGRTSMNAQ
jgi:hypothetical protein